MKKFLWNLLPVYRRTLLIWWTKTLKWSKGCDMNQKYHYKTKIRILSIWHKRTLLQMIIWVQILGKGNVRLWKISWPMRMLLTRSAYSRWLPTFYRWSGSLLELRIPNIWHSASAFKENKSHPAVLSVCGFLPLFRVLPFWVSCGFVCLCKIFHQLKSTATKIKSAFNSRYIDSTELMKIHTR